MLQQPNCGYVINCRSRTFFKLQQNEIDFAARGKFVWSFWTFGLSGAVQACCGVCCWVARNIISLHSYECEALFYLKIICTVCIICLCLVLQFFQFSSVSCCDRVAAVILLQVRRLHILCCECLCFLFQGCKRGLGLAICTFSIFVKNINGPSFT